MKCPACKTADLSPTSLEADLPAAACVVCEGNWISSSAYWAWLERHGPTLSEKPYEGSELSVSDRQEVKLCPECRRLMLRYRVGHGVEFSLDQCAGCNGIWLDRDEWAALKGRNLHDEIHLVFTAPWQSEVRREETRRRLDEIYARRFGEDYEEIKRVKAWLDAHPDRSTVLAFFNDRDPYSN
jgi:Zn-finger nucleic acid-binding protein